MGLGIPASVYAQCSCINCPVSLPDDTNIEFLGVIEVFNEDNNILGLNNTLEQVCIDITHTYIGDLDITLMAPDGTMVLLYGDGNNNSDLGGSETCPCGNSSNDMDVCFTLPGTTNNIFGTEGSGSCTDDTYSDPCNGGTPCYTGNWGTFNEGCQGGNGIAEFNNGTGTVSGTWFIFINDNAGADAGQINDIELIFSEEADSCYSLPPPEPPEPLPCQNPTVVTIPDNTGIPAFSTISNSGSVGTMGAGTELVQVCMLIQHTWIGDLDITLYEPDGSGVILSTSNGGSSNDYGDVSTMTEVCFSPTATNSITGYSGGQTGSWLPEGDFSDFNGDPNGNWSLLVLDDVGIDNGSILSWSLEFTTGECSDECILTTDLEASFCTGYSYDYNGVQLDSAGAYIDTFALSNGCDSIVTLTLTEIDLIVSTLDVVICEGEEYTINGSDFFDESGMYLDTLATDDCDSVVMLQLVVEPIRYNSIAVDLCPGESYDLPSGGIAATAGIYIDTVAGYFCDSIVTTTVTEYPQYDTTLFQMSCDAADTGLVIEILQSQFGCDSVINTRTDLAPSDSIGLFATACDPADAGTETFHYMNRFGCDSIVTVITEVGPNTSSVIATTCNPALEGITMETFTSSNGCDSIVTTETILLPSDTVRLTATTCNPADAGIQSTVLTNQYGCDSTIITTTTLLPSHDTTINRITCFASELGPVTDVLTNQFGCDSIITTISTLADTMQVEVLPAFSSIVVGESVEFTVLPDHGQINWLPPDFLTCDTCSATVSTPLNSITYVIARSFDDCVAYDTVRIDVRGPEVFVPTAFSPNGDGVNDILQVIPKFIDELLDFRVYNRWGELLFQTNDIVDGWNGEYQGQLQEMDSYIYFVDAILFTGDRVRQSDIFLLLR